MQTPDQTVIENNPLYNPNVALEFFKTAGVAETIEQGATIFAEKQKANRLLLQQNKMYLLLEGQVSLFKDGSQIGVINPGEIFGELAPLNQSSRSATTIASLPCRLLSLDEKQFHATLEKKPEFALMLMGVIIRRLRETLATKNANHASITEDKSGKETSVFSRKLMSELAEHLGNPMPTRILRQQTIFQEGGSGMLMYVVLEGRVTTSIDGKLVERIGPGGVIGEIALVDQAPRVGTVTAETNCALLAINRERLLELVKTQPSFGASLLRALTERLRFLVSGTR